MGHWNMRYADPTIDMDLDQQGQGHFHPEPSIIYGGIPDFRQPNFSSVLQTPGNRSNFDVHHLPQHHCAASYGVTQNSGVQHQYPATNIELAGSTTSNQYNMCMTPSAGTRVFPVPLNHGPFGHFPLSGNNGMVDVSADSYGISNQFMDGSGGSFKRKNAEGLSTNFPHCNAPAGTSFPGVPIIARPIESEVTSMDVDIPCMMDVGSHRSVTNRSAAIVNSPFPCNSNHMIQGLYSAQPFQISGTPWMDQQQFNGASGDIGTSSSNQRHALAPPYPHGSYHGGSGGCMETAANMGVQSYQTAASNRSSATFLPPPPAVPQGLFSLHHPPPPPMQGTRGSNVESSSQVATFSRRLSTSSTSHTHTEYGETGSRLVRRAPPSGPRISRPRRRELMLDEIARPGNLRQLRVLTEDGVALLELSGFGDMFGNVDHHRDMRLDIDHMSYEELLALGEQIGSVGSGLSEEMIRVHLKSKPFTPTTSCSNMEDTPYVDEQLNFCVICQTEYNDQEMMGILDCAHDYHLECIKKWLLVKNSCPICKCAALTTENKES